MQKARVRSTLLLIAAVVALTGCATGTGDVSPTPTLAPTAAPTVTATPTPSPTPTPTSSPTALALDCESISPPLWLADLQAEHPSTFIESELRYSFPTYEDLPALTPSYECTWGPADTDMWGDAGVWVGYAPVDAVTAADVLATLESRDYVVTEAPGGTLAISADPGADGLAVLFAPDGVHWAKYAEIFDEWTR